MPSQTNSRAPLYGPFKRGVHTLHEGAGKFSLEMSISRCPSPTECFREICILLLVIKIKATVWVIRELKKVYRVEVRELISSLG